jgi:hypothetical protein
MIAPVIQVVPNIDLKARLRTGVEIDLATPAEDSELRELLRRSPIPGPISVTFEREPSFYSSCRVRGDFVQIAAGRDRRSGNIIGLGTRTVAPGFINGEAMPLGYLADLRLEPQYRGGTLVARGYRFLRYLHQDHRTRLYTTVIFNDNHAALATIASGRAGLPQYHDQGTIHCPGINIRGAQPPLEAECKLVRGSEELLPAIIECLNRNNSRRQFAPVHTSEMFRKRWQDFRVDDFHVAVRGSRVIGVVACWDQRSFKQTRVASYGRRLEYMIPLANLLRPLTKAPRYPKAGEEVAYFYISFIAIDGDDLQIFRALLRSAYNSAVGGKYMYAMLALHERDPFLPALRDYSLTPFVARLFCVSYDDGEDLVRSLDGRVPHIEAATL